MIGGMRWAVLLAATLALQVPVKVDPDLGISETLAHARAARIANLRYDLAFTIPAARSEPLAARETVRFTLHDTADAVVLDFAPDRSGFLKRVEVNGVETEVRQVNGHLIVPAASFRAGENAIAVEFNAGDASLNRSDDFLYTIFVPARAHLAFPCFDQPDLKARWSLALDAPDGWQVLGNGAELERQTDAWRTRVRFAQTAPIATYLFAFAAGKFSVEQGERNGRTFRMFHRETDAAKVARNRDAIFDLHAAALKWLEDYTGIPYPFGKFDFFLVPAFQFGGMEHPGAIFYNANGLMLDESATQEQMLGRASVISHETSHMWFGDLVTMKWFNDVWMKEVFANYMAAKIVNPSFPHVNHDLRFLLDYYPQAYGVDRTAGTNEIRQPLANLNDAGTLYGAIIYQKAPIVMRQLETLMGAEAFRDGLREYLRKYSYGNATWTDLITMLDDRTPEDLAAFSRAWVEERGRPVIRTDTRFSNGRIARLSFTQQDPYPDRGLTWNQRFTVAAGAQTVTAIPVQLNAARVDVMAARGVPAAFVLPNGGGIAYGEIHLDPASLSWLMQHLGQASTGGDRRASGGASAQRGGESEWPPPSGVILDELTRGSAWVTLWDAVLDGEVKPDAFAQLALKALPLETNELNVSRVLSYGRDDYWRYTAPEARLRLAPRLETVLRAGLDAAKTQTLKSVWFSALRDMAQTKDTIDWLTRVWRHDEKIPGLTLSETDDIRLAEELAVRGVSDAATIVDEQFARTKNPDRKAQFAFVRPALSASQAERDAWFASLADVANRRHEPWVLEGLRYLHHPLRADASEKYIADSLMLLREIQRTGDIFFPKRWMDATLSGHRSPAAASIVRAFVDRLPPQYPLPLRRVILSSADDLFRAAKVPAPTAGRATPRPEDHKDPE
jgi:aminopeptidase N